MAGVTTYLVALGIPLILIALGALVKKLVRGSGWQHSDFFLGVELALASVSSALIFIFELSSAGTGQGKETALGVFTVTCLFLFFVVMSFHQDWEKRPHDTRGQMIWLGGICNLIGISLMASFVLFVKGIS